MPHLGVITGLVSEAGCFNEFSFEQRPAIRVSGANAVRAREAAQALVSSGCVGLMSFGLSGAVDPELTPGDVLIADQVICPNGRHITPDKEWRMALESVLAPSMAAASVKVIGSETVALTETAKMAQRMISDAAAVDMESHAVAEVADRHGLPFAALRVVADRHSTNIPAWTLRNIRQDGGIRMKQMALGFMVRPWHWPALAALAVANHKAEASLRRAVLRIGPGLQFLG